MPLRVRRETLVLILESTLKFVIWASKTTQWVKVLIYNPSSTPESLKVSFDPCKLKYIYFKSLFLDAFVILAQNSLCRTG